MGRFPTEHTKVFSYYNSPVGRLLLAGGKDGLHLISFPKDRYAQQIVADWRRDDDFFSTVMDQLTAYFAGELKTFDLTLRFAGTEFQNDVWRGLCTIPIGETLSYGELAKRIGRPKAVRAVGAANGANPLPIVVPCHRVIGADHSLTGFGGGLAVKKYLLEHEEKWSSQPRLL
jgi:methylated-DNA-[protein]-cysteine S-methyltransferase